MKSHATIEGIVFELLLSMLIWAFELSCYQNIAWRDIDED